jgi:hypothetical protein
VNEKIETKTETESGQQGTLKRKDYERELVHTIRA